MVCCCQEGDGSKKKKSKKATGEDESGNGANGGNEGDKPVEGMTEAQLLETIMQMFSKYPKVQCWIVGMSVHADRVCDVCWVRCLCWLTLHRRIVWPFSHHLSSLSALANPLNGSTLL